MPILGRDGQPIRGAETKGAKPSADFSSIGSTGLREWGGWINDDFDPSLRGLQGKRTIREMAENHAVITGILLGIEMTCRQVGYSIEPGTDDKEGEDIAEFVEGALHDMTDSFEDKIGEIIQGELPYGFHVAETNFKRRDGINSKFDDGKIGWADWQIRGQETVRHWVFDPSNQAILGMVQIGAPDFQEHFIPLALGYHPDYGHVKPKGLLFRTTSAKGNPEGKSILRGAYLAWKFQKQYLLLEGIGIARDLVGLPWAKIPGSIINSSDPNDQITYRAWVQTMTNLARNEQEGLVYSSDRDENGNPLYEVGLMNSGGARQFDLNATIARFDDRIAVSMLAGFILMGLNGVGSQALGASVIQMWTTAMGAILGGIMSVINTHAIPRLLALNGIQTETPPTISHGRIERADFLSIAQALASLSGTNARGAGFALDTRMDGPTMKALMEMLGLPEPPNPAEIDVQVSDPAMSQDNQGKPPEPAQQQSAQQPAQTAPKPAQKTVAKAAAEDPDADIEDAETAMFDKISGAMRDHWKATGARRPSNNGHGSS